MILDPKTFTLDANERSVLEAALQKEIKSLTTKVAKEQARMAKRYSPNARTIINSLEMRLARAQDLLEGFSA